MTYHLRISSHTMRHLVVMFRPQHFSTFFTDDLLVDNSNEYAVMKLAVMEASKIIIIIIMKCTKVPGTLIRTYANDTCAYLISTCGIRRACHFSQNG